MTFLDDEISQSTGFKLKARSWVVDYWTYVYDAKSQLVSNLDGSFRCNGGYLVHQGLSLLLQLCQNGRSLSSVRGTELYNLHSSVPLALISDRPF
ncbi:hypothetical protein SFRURICE_018664 [Spodoptera frugiperda]|nr:hypothetical protein SFRURICE_018664 [Spodoptera frugiperda]